MEKDKKPKAMASKGSSAAHSKLVTEVITILGCLPICRVWKNATGAIKTPDGYIRYGLVGSADISGITIDGKRLEIECKTGNAKQTKKQIAFMNMIRKFGGRYYVVRDADEILELLNADDFV